MLHRQEWQGQEVCWHYPVRLIQSTPLFSSLLLAGLSRTGEDLLLIRELLVESFPSLLASTAWLHLPQGSSLDKFSNRIPNTYRLHALLHLNLTGKFLGILGRIIGIIHLEAYPVSETMDGVEADLNGIRNSDIICWEYSEPSDNLTRDDGWEPADDGTGMIMRMNPKTSGLIVSSADLHLSHISPTNLLEWIYRLDSFFDAGNGYLSTWTTEGEVPIRLTLHDLRDHVGLKTSAKNWPKSRFDNRVRELRIVRHLDALNDELS